MYLKSLRNSWNWHNLSHRNLIFLKDKSTVAVHFFKFVFLGGYGFIFLAQDSSNGKEYALKVCAIRLYC